MDDTEKYFKVVEYTKEKRKILDGQETILNPFFQDSGQCDDGEDVIVATFKLIDSTLIDKLVQYDYSHNTELGREVYKSMFDKFQCTFDYYNDIDDEYAKCLGFKDGEQTNYVVYVARKDIHKLSENGCEYVVYTL